MGCNRLNQWKAGFFFACCPKADVFRKVERTPRREDFPFLLKVEKIPLAWAGQRCCDVHSVAILPLEGSEGRFFQAAVREELHAGWRTQGRGDFLGRLEPGEETNPLEIVWMSAWTGFKPSH